jgi:hypothetical protein
VLNCKEASRLLSQAQETELPVGTRMKLWLHLLACDACTHFASQLRVLREAMNRFRE